MKSQYFIDLLIKPQIGDENRRNVMILYYGRLCNDLGDKHDSIVTAFQRKNGGVYFY